MKKQSSIIITDPEQLRLIVMPTDVEVDFYVKDKVMNIVFARQTLPSNVKSIFLAGPTPRSKDTKSWRPEAINHLRALGYIGHIFVPEEPDFTFSDWQQNFPYDEQVGWEHQALEAASCVMFWVPRNMKDMPALTTNDEWGSYKTSGKVVFGAPTEAQHVRYQRWHAKRLNIPNFTTLKETCEAAIAHVQR